MLSLECPAGTFGTDCSQKCSCLNGGICDKKTGGCDCGLGWTGKYCEEGKPIVLTIN